MSTARDLALTGSVDRLLRSRTTTLDQVERNLEDSADVVVIGSGAGGAVAAAELALGGRSVILVEEGGLFTTADFWPADGQANTMHAVLNLYRGVGASPILARPSIRFAEGRCVGGSTVINGGMTWRTPERVLRHWEREEGLGDLGPAPLEPLFTRVEHRISARPQDPETIGRDTALLAEGARSLGYHVLDNIRNQRHCAGSNQCAWGCPTGAKQSTLLTYVPDALNAGARLYANCRALRIRMPHGRVEGVDARFLSPTGRPSHRLRLTAPVVVVAGGAAQTPALLARSGVRNYWLGRNLKVHPNAKAIGIFPEAIRGWEGVHQGHQVREFQEEGLIFAVANVPPGLLAMSMSQVGREMGEIMDCYDRMLIAGCLAEDSGAGRVRVTPGGRPIMTYRFARLDGERLKRGLGILAEILFTAGAERVLLPFEDLPQLHSPDDIPLIFDRRVRISRMEILTVHIMGSARMGRSPERGVTDPYGGVWGVRGLAVADASLFPGPIGVNPMETIMALATRTAWHLLDEWPV